MVHTFLVSRRRHYGTGFTPERHNDRGGPSSDTASSREHEVAGPASWHHPKTVAKWKKRESTVDRRTGPSVPRSTVLTVAQEAIIVAFRKHTLLPLDDCLYALQATIPQLVREVQQERLRRRGSHR